MVYGQIVYFSIIRFMYSFLFYSLYSYWSYNFLALKGDIKNIGRTCYRLKSEESDNYHYCYNYNDYRKRNKRKKKYQNEAKKPKINYFKWSNSEKSNIAIENLTNWWHHNLFRPLGCTNSILSIGIRLKKIFYSRISIRV